MVEGFDPEVERSGRVLMQPCSRRAERSINLNPKRTEYFALDLINPVSQEILKKYNFFQTSFLETRHATRNQFSNKVRLPSRAEEL